MKMNQSYSTLNDQYFVEMLFQLTKPSGLGMYTYIHSIHAYELF